MFFPLIVYSDRSNPYRFKSRTLYPIIVSSACLPRSLWKKADNKHTLCFVDATMNEKDALSIIVSKLEKAEEGYYCITRQGSIRVVSPVLVWLGDMLECNAIAGLFPKACRVCLPDGTKRTKELYLDVQEELSMVDGQGLVNLKSQYQQYAGEVIFGVSSVNV